MVMEKFLQKVYIWAQQPTYAHNCDNSKLMERERPSLAPSPHMAWHGGGEISAKGM
jgi:hypothetical protein